MLAVIKTPADIIGFNEKDLTRDGRSSLIKSKTTNFILPSVCLHSECWELYKVVLRSAGLYVHGKGFSYEEDTECDYASKLVDWLAWGLSKCRRFWLPQLFTTQTKCQRAVEEDKPDTDVWTWSEFYLTHVLHHMYNVSDKQMWTICVDFQVLQGFTVHFFHHPHAVDKNVNFLDASRNNVLIAWILHRPRCQIPLHTIS